MRCARARGTAADRFRFGGLFRESVALRRLVKDEWETENPYKKNERRRFRADTSRPSIAPRPVDRFRRRRFLFSSTAFGDGRDEGLARPRARPLARSRQRRRGPATRADSRGASTLSPVNGEPRVDASRVVRSRRCRNGKRGRGFRDGVARVRHAGGLQSARRARGDHRRRRRARRGARVAPADPGLRRERRRDRHARVDRVVARRRALGGWGLASVSERRARVVVARGAVPGARLGDSRDARERTRESLRGGRSDVREHVRFERDGDPRGAEPGRLVQPRRDGVAGRSGGDRRGGARARIGRAATTVAEVRVGTTDVGVRGFVRARERRSHDEARARETRGFALRARDVSSGDPARRGEALEGRPALGAAQVRALGVGAGQDPASKGREHGAHVVPRGDHARLRGARRGLRHQRGGVP